MAWMIDNKLEEGKMKKVEIFFPHNAHPWQQEVIDFNTRENMTIFWQALDDDHDILVSGKMDSFSDNHHLEDIMDWCMNGYGCTSLWLLQNGTWECIVS